MSEKISGTYLIVLAGGRGKRMGSDTPKQFLELEGKNILQRTIENFSAALPGIKVIVVLPKEHIQTWKYLCLKNDFMVSQTLVEGGFTRFHSVQNGLSKVPDGAIVAIQDGVRPLMTQERIREMYAYIRDSGVPGLVPVVPAGDTLRIFPREPQIAVSPVSLYDTKEEVDPETGETILHELSAEAANLPVYEIQSDARSVDRSRILCAQTPQWFQSSVIKDAYSQPYDTAFTDDASVAEKKQVPIVFCDGERLNLKVTVPDDIFLATSVLRMRRRAKQLEQIAAQKRMREEQERINNNEGVTQKPL